MAFNSTSDSVAQIASSDSMFTTPVIISLVLAVTGILFLNSRKEKRNLPPSPRALPLIGHTHLLSSVPYTWRTLHDISVSIGSPDVMYMKLGTSDVIVVNSVQATNDLMEKKGSIYSDRPRLVVPTELISNNRRVVLTYYSDRWRKFRKFLHSVLFDKQAAQYEPVQEREAKALLLNLADQPADFHNHLLLFSSNIILQTTFNRRASTVKDKDIQDLLYDVATWMLSANPGAHLVHDFPFLDKLPDFLAPWRAHGRKLHDFELQLYTSLASTVKNQMAKGETPECIMRYLFEKQKEYNFDEEDILYLGGTLFEAGSDTTTSLLISLFLACARDPKICATAQAEVDRVVGADRMPSFADNGSMPFIEALALELQRWRPAVPSAVPHALMEDDIYNDWFLPKGATIIPNTWAIGRDTKYFPDGEDFRPERFMPGKERDHIMSGLNRGHTGFGFGRRVCPGLHLAERSLFIAIASIFWAFDVLPPVNELIPDQFNFTSGFVSHSKHFNVTIKPRSEAKMKILRSEANHALQEMTAHFT